VASSIPPDGAARMASPMRIGPAMRALRRRQRPVRLGSLASTVPHGKAWGYDRGRPVDRWYIERFLAEHRDDITGRVLEVKDSGYTDRFGQGVTERAVVDIDPANDRATYVSDLTTGAVLPTAAFDCFVCTQTLQFVFDVRSALATAHRLLRPGGVLLATMPVTSRVCQPPLSDYWRFTPASAARLLEDAFGPGAATVRGDGNVLSQTAFLQGLAAEDLTAAELAIDDREHPLIVCARAVRAEGAPA
jgi:SAM-dependent methyltransferase